jgi:peptide/nickel transport system permease protein
VPPIVRYAGRKSATAFGTMVFVIVFNFFLFHAMPGDPIALYTRGRNMDGEQLRRLREQFHRPLLEQFVHYLANPFDQVVNSTRFNTPVWSLIGSRVWATVLLLGVSTLLSAAIGIWIGARAGWRPGSRFDRVWSTVSLFVYAMPEFWLGMLLLMVFAAGAFGLPAILPVNGMNSPDAPATWWGQTVDTGAHLVLPALTLTLAYLAEYVLVMRASVIDERSQDYLNTARAKGLMDRQVRDRHAVPNALLPTTTLIFLNIGFIMSGAITVETVFSWPGLGLLTYDALSGPDIPLLQALFLLFSGGVVLSNLIADVLYAVLDPRVRG